LIWQDDKVVYDWAIAQNNLGYALKLLASHADSDEYQAAILKQSVQAFQHALRVYRAAKAGLAVSQTQTNLAHVEAFIADHSIAAE